MLVAKYSTTSAEYPNYTGDMSKWWTNQCITNREFAEYISVPERNVVKIPDTWIGIWLQAYL
jgi:hypothetical protein